MNNQNKNNQPKDINVPQSENKPQDNQKVYKTIITKENSNFFNSVVSIKELQSRIAELESLISIFCEKFDENGYDFPPEIKLQRADQHITHSIKTSFENKDVEYLSMRDKIAELEKQNKHLELKFQIACEVMDERIHEWTRRMNQASQDLKGKP